MRIGRWYLRNGLWRLMATDSHSSEDLYARGHIDVLNLGERGA
jgi:hypothetical protein